MKREQIPTIIGLIVSIVMPGILLIDYVYNAIKTLPLFLNGIVPWTLTVIVILLIIFWEKRPLSSIGLKRFTWKTIVTVIGFLFAVIIANHLSVIIFVNLGVPPPNQNIERLINNPVWVRLVLCFQAGITEEILFRAYPIERILELTKSKFLAVVTPLVMFALVHFPGWGPAQMLYVTVSGLVLSIQYIWRRDLIANMMVHFIVVFLGIIFFPMLNSS